MNSFKDCFVDRMKKARKVAGLTQKELAEKSNIPHSTLAAYENTNRTAMPDAESLTKIAQTLGVSIDWLCGNDSEKNNQREITSAQWLRRFVEMLDNPPTYPARGTREGNEITLHINAIQLEAFEGEYRLTFVGPEMADFFRALKGLEMAKPAIQDQYLMFRDVIIDKAAHCFDPDHENTKISKKQNKPGKFTAEL